MRHAICYVSNCSNQISVEEIKDLLSYCQEQNIKKDIKGILLYSEGNFFQILEGEKEVVLDIYIKIQNDPRHYGLVQVIGRDIIKGSYDSYKVDIIGENLTTSYDLPNEYIKALKGIPLDIKKPMEMMLKRFIATR